MLSSEIIRKSIINSANVTLDSYSIIISLLIVISIFVRNKKLDKPSMWFAITNIATILYDICDIFMWISEGTDAVWKLIALPLSSFLFYFFGILIFIFYISYIISYYNSIDKVKPKHFIFCIIMCSIYLILLFLTPSLGFFYHITEDNLYVRGNFFISTVIIELSLYFEALFLVFKFRKKCPKYQNVAFASFIFIPFIFQIIQILNFGVALISIGLATSFLVIFISVIQRLQENLEQYQIEKDVKEKELLHLQEDTIINLTSLIEQRDIDSTDHIKRIKAYIDLFLNSCIKDNVYPDEITASYITFVKDAVPYHDIGNIIVPISILQKPGKLTDEEFCKVQEHTVQGSRIVKEILSIGSDYDIIRITADICLNHHEKWNGRGYPNHLEKDNIPLSARIFAICDVYDALVTPRCYKMTISYAEAFKILEKESGEHFDPLLISEFLKIKDKIIEINEKFANKDY